MNGHWFTFFAVAAYLAFAVNSVIDKFLLRKAVKHPATYAFFIGLLSGLALFLFPLGFAFPGAKIILLALVSGAAFVYAMVALFAALKLDDASKILPVIGAIVPIVTLFLSFFIVGERLNAREISGIIILILGTLLIGVPTVKKKDAYHWLGFAAVSAILFALSFTLVKAVYLDQSFISGLIWTRVGMVAAACTLLAFSAVRSDVFYSVRNSDSGSLGLFFVGQVLAAAGGILQNYAVSLGSVTIVNALQGTQFAFLFLLTWFLSARFPKILKEDFSPRTFSFKIISLALISFGLFLII